MVNPTADSSTRAPLLLAEPDADKRAALVAAWGAGIDLVQALKDEVDRLKNPDGARALLAGERALEVSAVVLDVAARPLGLWAYALGLTVQGRFAEALPAFDEARRLYDARARPVDGARAVMRQVQALAMTGGIYARLGRTPYSRNSKKRVSTSSSICSMKPKDLPNPW